MEQTEEAPTQTVQVLGVSVGRRIRDLERRSDSVSPIVEFHTTEEVPFYLFPTWWNYRMRVHTFHRTPEGGLVVKGSVTLASDLSHREATLTFERFHPRAYHNNGVLVYVFP